MRKGLNPASHASLAKWNAENPKRRHRLTYATLAKVVKRMMDGRFTVRQLHTSAGISKTSAWNIVQAWHDAGCIHIVDYTVTRNARNGSAVYVWGSGDDLPRPRAQTAAEKSKKLRTKQHRGPFSGTWLNPAPFSRRSPGDISEG
jgi:hypothetical protein